METKEKENCCSPSCCGDETQTATMISTDEEIRESVREKYATRRHNRSFPL